MTTLEDSERARVIFETTDLNLASFLYCRNFFILDIKRLPDGQTALTFEDSEALRIAIVDYANNGVVPVRTFCATLRDLEAVTR